ncbi:MAG TPA: DUF3037 domain-containing protein [Marmoricola sp.]|nr:DUF3037 domain-containing protein [Marmoricola sp.]
MTRLPYQYVVLRCVPRVEREEFLNVGVVLYCEEAGVLAAAHHLDEARLESFGGIDQAALDAHLCFIDAVCRGDESVGDIAARPTGVRFGFLRAPRSTVVQPGPVHGGLTDDPLAEVEHLIERLVR